MSIIYPLNNIHILAGITVYVGYSNYKISSSVPPEYSTILSLSITVMEGTSEYFYQFTLNNNVNPVPTNFTWRRGSEEISNSARITITVKSITIRNVGRSDSGIYVVTANNAAGRASANFTMDVQCEYCILHICLCWKMWFSTRILGPCRLCMNVEHFCFNSFTLSTCSDYISDIMKSGIVPCYIHVPVDT